MSPEQKQQLVQELQALGYYVAMCGDGANDCGALKAAHTGISLSEAESSVASPFTSKNPNISCVIEVIKEGRAALVTSFGIFKYMAAYSICQFMSVLILYTFESNLTDMEFLFIDLCIISVFAFFFGKTASYSGKLAKEPPLTSLISLSPILSLFLQLLLIFIFQIGSFWYLSKQPWYTPFHHTGDDRDNVACKENYTIFTITSFQYITLAIVFSKGKPYRQTIFSNIGFLLTSIILVSFSTYLALTPTTYIANFFSLDVPKDFNFRLTLVLLAVIYFIICFLIESVVIDLIVFKKCSQDMDKSAKYKIIHKDLDNDTKWPPITSTTDFTTTATPDNTMPTCTAEIVVEKENKFDKNHVLNKLYNASDNGQNVENQEFDNFQIMPTDNVVPNGDLNKVSFQSINTNKNPERKLSLKTISDVNLNKKMEFIASNKSKINMSDTNLCSTPSRFSNLKNFESNLGKNAAISEDLFTSVQSNFNNLSSGSDTFKSFSPSDTTTDIFGSNCNISELPYDEDENMKLTSNSSGFTSDLSSTIDERSRNDSIKIDNFYNDR
ncbi:hypothetical protein WA026_005141 [Henosepilachna vigintioctopunctata]|uniref:Uncharacterized protein n=1 Tax=Henosepilachna vigintioctopunctata TaxID=420089 RepID=A0AAW1USP9_9CUCU